MKSLLQCYQSGWTRHSILFEYFCRLSSYFVVLRCRYDEQSRAGIFAITLAIIKKVYNRSECRSTLRNFTQERIVRNAPIQDVRVMRNFLSKSILALSFVELFEIRDDQFLAVVDEIMSHLRRIESKHSRPL